MSKRRIKRPERDEVLELVEERGLRAAIQAAIDVCEDRDAAPPARATAAGLLMRVGAIGGFSRTYVPPEPAGGLDHLPAEEQQAARDRYLKKLDWEIAEYEAELAAQEADLAAEEAALDEEEAELDEAANAEAEPADDEDDTSAFD